MYRTSRWMVPVALVVVAIAATAWLINSLVAFHKLVETYSTLLAYVFIGAAVLVMLASSLAATRFFWAIGRGPRAPAQAPADVVKAAEVQAEKAESVIAQLRDQAARVDLQKELTELRADRQQQRFHVVIFGTSSAGKTSLINALLGRHVGKTEAVMGTTRHGETFSHTIEGVDGAVILTDTPGLSEIGAGGMAREVEARELAAAADLVLFVVDHDLTRSEFDPLSTLARIGKRSIVILNKKDRFIEADRDAILDKLRERLRGIVAPLDVVAISAAPRPLPVRVQNPEGQYVTITQPEPPDIETLQDRIAAVLVSEGDALRAGNLLVRAHMISKKAQDQLGRERDEKAQSVIDRFQWITAATVFTNPLPALDLMATGAVQFQMISELAACYGVELTSAHVRMIGGQMIQMLLKLGMVEAATSLIAGLFKSSFVGYAAGGAVQCVSMAYLTHVSGQTFREYFARGQTWGDGGMQAALVRQFDLNSRAEFLQEFARQAIDKVLSKALKSKGETPAQSPRGGA